VPRGRRSNKDIEILSKTSIPATAHSNSVSIPIKDDDRQDQKPFRSFHMFRLIHLTLDNMFIGICEKDDGMKNSESHFRPS
jgi:hypothetical protein